MMLKKWVSTGKNFKQAIRKKHLKAQLEFSFVDDILRDKRNKSTVAKKRQ